MANTTTIRSYAKGIDQAPRKVALVASLVRRRTVADALVILAHTPKRAALPVIKAIESAKSNAVNTHGLDAKTLTISTLSVTAGSRLKRFKPASRGRALPFQKKSANILVEVTGDVKAKKAPAVAKAEVAETKPSTTLKAGEEK
jgi:large subunit ribosomal protein L22